MFVVVCTRNTKSLGRYNRIFVVVYPFMLVTGSLVCLSHVCTGNRGTRGYLVPPMDDGISLYNGFNHCFSSVIPALPPGYFDH